MGLKMTPELRNTLETLKNTCSYILPIDEETRQNEINKAKNKSIKETNNSSKEEKENTSLKIDNKIIIENSEKDISDTSIEVLKTKPARVNKEEVKDVKKHEHHVDIKEIREMKQKVADIENEEEIEDEDFDKIETNFKKEESKKIQQIEKVNESKDDIPKEYIDAVIEKNEKHKKIDLGMSLDNKTKPNAAPKLNKNKKILVNDDLDAKGITVVKENDKNNDKKIIQKNDKLHNSVEFKTNVEHISQINTKKSNIEKNNIEEKNIKANYVSVKDKTKSKDKEQKKNSSSSISMKKSIKPTSNKTTKTIPKQPVVSSIKNKNDKIKNRKLNFDINKLETAKEKIRRQRGIAVPPEQKVQVPENYQGDTEFLKNIFNFDNDAGNRDYTSEEEKINGFTVYSHPEKVTSKKAKIQKKQSEKQVKITPLQDNSIKELYYPTLKDSYNVQDKEIEKNRKKHLLEKQSISDENAYAIYKQQEATKTMQKNNALKMKDFKPRRK